MNSQTKEISEAVVYLVDDDESFRKSTSRLLRLSQFPVRDFPSVGEFLLNFPRGSRGCLILDIRMPGPNGMELFKKLRVEEPHLPIVFLTGHGDVSIAVGAMRRGAFDFLTKPVEKKRLLEIVSNALQHEEDTRKANSDRVGLRERFETLTATEKRVFHLVVEGLPNKAIASEIGNAERTVKLHRSNLSRKLGAQCVADLVRFYYEAGLE